MRPLVPLLFACALLCGCQSPIVPARLMTYKAEAVIDGKPVTLRKDYTCHYEDLTYFCERGSEWHDRKGWHDIRVVGALEDGTPYELVPDVIDWGTWKVFCAEDDTPHPSRLYLSSGDSSVLSFDALHTDSPGHVIRLGGAKTVSRASIPAVYRQSPQGDAEPKARWYHSIWATAVPGSVWRENPELVSVVDGKSLGWLERGKFPEALGERNNRALDLYQHDRKIRDYLKNAVPIAFERRNGVWLRADQRLAVRWFSDDADAKGPKGGSRVEYAGALLEVSPRSSVMYYVPEEDSLVVFSFKSVSLLH